MLLGCHIGHVAGMEALQPLDGRLAWAPGGASPGGCTVFSSGKHRQMLSI